MNLHFFLKLIFIIFICLIISLIIYEYYFIFIDLIYCLNTLSLTIYLYLFNYKYHFYMNFKFFITKVFVSVIFIAAKNLTFIESILSLLLSFIQIFIARCFLDLLLLHISF